MSVMALDMSRLVPAVTLFSALKISLGDGAFPNTFLYMSANAVFRTSWYSRLCLRV